MKPARVIVVLALLAAAALALMLLAAGAIVAFIDISGWLGLHHALGTDTQTSENYALASGSGPMLIAVLGFSGVFVTAWKHINCEQPGCWRPGHRHPEHGRPVCRKHYHHDVAPERQEESP